VDGTATGGGACFPGTDFLNPGGTLSLPAGEVSGTITVPICGDTTAESDEAFTLIVRSPIGTDPPVGIAVGTILNDDGALTTSTPTPTQTPTPTATAIPTTPPSGTAGTPTATPAQQPVTVSVSRAGQNRLAVTVTALGTMQQIAWTPSPNVAVEDAVGRPYAGTSISLPTNSRSVVFYVRRLEGNSATLPLTLTGSFGTWRTFVGGGANAW
jgi:hypothetical protein